AGPGPAVGLGGCCDAVCDQRRTAGDVRAFRFDGPRSPVTDPLSAVLPVRFSGGRRGPGVSRAGTRLPPQAGDRSCGEFADPDAGGLLWCLSATGGDDLTAGTCPPVTLQLVSQG